MGVVSLFAPFEGGPPFHNTNVNLFTMSENEMNLFNLDDVSDCNR